MSPLSFTITLIRWELQVSFDTMFGWFSGPGKVDLSAFWIGPFTCGITERARL